MTPERKEELARELGLTEVPKLRYEQDPDENVPLERTVNFRKALKLVDPIRTAAFEFFIPDDLIVDMEMDSRSYSEGMSDARLIRTDVPPPVDPAKDVNRKISRATGVPYELNDRAYFIWLGQELRTMYLSYGARKMAPPLIFAGRGDKQVPGARPFIGIICKFKRNMYDEPPNWGAIAPLPTISEGSRVVPVLPVVKGASEE